ncbi:hypothetical protein BFW87_11250 [Pseudomonas fluorescens]|uniref:Uncharacterized protein n=1 Tax=Pseudomonas fluorescens TaxID=294 RepID=A0A1T2YYI1_PSEFL|nr:hypothetical protein BFW87_11250 [Pseudomonas fluorescens]
MVTISFVSKDNEGNQNLLVKDRQVGRTIFCLSPTQCGSWLACDSGVSGDINAECQTAIAGKPAPTGGRVSQLDCG